MIVYMALKFYSNPSKGQSIKQRYHFLKNKKKKKIKT